MLNFVCIFIFLEHHAGDDDDDDSVYFSILNELPLIQLERSRAAFNRKD